MSILFKLKVLTSLRPIIKRSGNNGPMSVYETTYSGSHLKTVLSATDSRIHFPIRAYEIFYPKTESRPTKLMIIPAERP